MDNRIIEIDKDKYVAMTAKQRLTLIDELLKDHSDSDDRTILIEALCFVMEVCISEDFTLLQDSVRYGRVGCD